MISQTGGETGTPYRALTPERQKYLADKDER